MGMPKGFKSRKGYATVSQTEGGLDYRSIAERMTAGGDKMNHSSARNGFISAMEKFAAPVLELYQMETDEKTVTQTAKDPDFQSGLLHLLKDLQEKGEITWRVK